ncbi:MAG: M56 family metallopeptidase [Planctomycetota bacterium]|jgi:beta-lactamase regulating signal transducer with metallopeptidase domain
MNTLIENINWLGKAYADFALPMLIQSSGVLLALLLAELVLRRKVPAVVRYWVWVAALAQFVLPSFLPVPVRVDNWLRSEAATWPATPLTWHGIFLLVWVAGAAGIGAVKLRGVLLVNRLIWRAREANSLMKGNLWYCRTCMGVKREIRLKVSEKVTSAASWGLLRPVILVPHNLAPTLGSRHLRSVLLNELAHIRRGDLWVNFLQTALQVVYFYNPVLWVANGVIRRVREQAVDETVVGAMGERAAWYPETQANVLKLARGRRDASISAAGISKSKSNTGRQTKPGRKGEAPKKNAKSHKLTLVRAIIAVLFSGFGS